MARAVLITLALFISVSTLGQTDAEKSFDKWSKKLVKALRKKDVDKVMTFFYDKEDITSMSPPDAKYDVDEVYQVFEENKLRNIEQTLERGELHGVVWKKIKIEDLSYREVQTHENGTVEAVAKIYIIYEEEAFILLLSPCMYYNGEWNLADYIFFEEHDHH